MTVPRPAADHPPQGRADPVAYDEPRGVCPRCGSGAVTHLVGGLLPGPLAGPRWAAAVGCCVPAHDRECERCDARWTSASGPQA